MHYVKIWSSILDGSLADDYETRHVYEDLLKLADADGVVDMTANAIAARLRAPVGIVLASIAKLSAPDPNSRTPDEDGRRILLLGDRSWGWRIVNWHIYRHMRSKEDVRAQARLRAAEYRERNTASHAVTPRHTPSHEVTPGSRQEVVGRRKKDKDPPIGPPTGDGLASLGRHPPDDPGVVVFIPCRVKPRSAEIHPWPVRTEVLAALQDEYRDVDVRGELVEIRRWSLAQAQKPRRGKLWHLVMPGVHKWLRKASSDAKSGNARASPAANHRAAVDEAYREANAVGAAAPEAVGGEDPLTEFLAGGVK